MSSNLQNSIWPNEGGNLGQIKVQIPDGVTTTWPTGDALVGNFVYNKGKLVGFVDTKALIANDSKSTTFPYDYVNISLPSIADGEMTYNYDQCSYFILNGEVLLEDFKYKGCKTVADIIALDPNYLTNDIIDGVWNEGLGDLEQGGNGNTSNGGMFNTCSQLTTFNSKLSSLTDGNRMFYYCFRLNLFNSDLSSLTDGSYMFYHCTALTSFNCNNLSSLTNGSYMFDTCTNLTSFNSKLSSLTHGSYMFKECTNLTSFNSDLSSLTNGENMFYNCDNLTTFNSNLSSLSNGSWMFSSCDSLTSFSSDLSSLTKGEFMFNGCNNLSSFNSNLSSLTKGLSMFYYCTKLTTFTSDLSSLTNGSQMFNGCRRLNSFNSDLSSLTHGEDMFKNCNLDTASFQHIAETINSPTEKGNIDFSVSRDLTDEDHAACRAIADKNWVVTLNGVSPDPEKPTNPINTTSLDENIESVITPIPFYAKPVEVEESKARYVGEDGKFYRIQGGQFIYGDNLETYGMFLNEEDAAAQMRLTKIEK